MAKRLAVVALLALFVGQSTAQTSIADDLQSVLSGISTTAGPALQQLGQELLSNYQQTLQGFLTQFTTAANTAGNVQQAANNLITSQTASTVGNTESFITQLVSAANALSSNAFAADLPVIGQVANGVQYIEQSAQDAAAQLQQLQAEFENAYCTPAVYTPPVWVPANLTGPGFSVAFSAGNCTFDPEQLLSPDGAIQCVGPSVTLDQTPSFLTLGYQGAASLQGQQCEISQTFGESTTEVLYVFDPTSLLQQDMPLEAITSYLQQELSAVLNSLGIPGLVSQAESAAVSAAQQGASQAQGAVNQAEATAAPYVQQAVSLAGQVINQTEATPQVQAAQNLASQAVNQTQKAVDGAEAAVTPYLSAAQSTLGPILNMLKPTIATVTPPAGPIAAPTPSPNTVATTTAAMPQTLLPSQPATPMPTSAAAATPLPTPPATVLPTPVASTLPSAPPTVPQQPAATVVVEVPAASLTVTGR